MRRALFVVDDRPEAGRGHVVRCGALAAELQSRGWETETLPVSVRNKKWSDGIYDACIADLRHDYRARAHGLATLARNLVVVDDVGEHVPEHTALLVNGGAGATPEMYADSGAARVLAGPQYALLREEFRMTEWPLNSGLDVFDARRPSTLDARQIACRMASGRITATAAGMRCLEAACVGAPMVLFIESEDQRMNAEALQRKCAGVIARDEDHARYLVRDLLKDPDWLARMSYAGRKMVDGKGTQRVADAIEELV